MKVSSVNVQNRYKQKKYSGIDNEINISEMFTRYLVERNVDIAGTQELVPNFISRIDTRIENYSIVGDTRFKGLKSKIMKKYNETNSIISKEKIIYTKTFHLPWFPSTLPRIVTVSILETKSDGQICFLNTHLDFLFDFVKHRQLNALKRIILKYKEIYPLVLTGDFNMDLDDLKFVKFINDLEQIGIVRVPILERTYRYYKKNSPIDHIFISDDLEIQCFEVVKDPKYNFSDHYPVECIIKKK